MTRKKKAQKRPAARASSTVARLPVGPEWWLAIRHMDEPLDDAPDGVALVVWAIDDGRVADAEPIPKGPDLERRIAQRTLRAMREPAVGDAHRPRVLRVADPALAATLRATLEGAVRVVEEPTPDELERLLDQMEAQLAPVPLIPDVSTATLRALFESAAALYEVAPWHAEVPFLLRSDEEELDGRVVSLMGDAGGDPGFMVLDTVDDLLAMVRSDGPPQLVNLPPSLALRFTSPDPEARARIRELRLPLAGPAAVPTVALMVGGVPEEPDEDDVILAASIARALASGLAPHREALRSGQFFRASATIVHRGRSVDVELGYGVESEDFEDERTQLEQEAEHLEDWLGALLDDASSDLDVDEAIADPSWVKELPAELRGRATRLLERIALVREHREEVERELEEG